MRWRVIVTAFFMISLMATEAERSAKSFELQKLTGWEGWLAPAEIDRHSMRAGASHPSQPVSFCILRGSYRKYANDSYSFSTCTIAN